MDALTLPRIHFAFTVTYQVGIVWWTIGTLLAIDYSCTAYRLLRGQVPTSSDGYSH